MPFPVGDSRPLPFGRASAGARGGRNGGDMWAENSESLLRSPRRASVAHSVDGSVMLLTAFISFPILRLLVRLSVPWGHISK